MRKKLLLLSVVFGIYIPANSQVLQTENFNSLTVGDVGSDLGGTTAGQGDLFTYVGSGGANSDFQVVNEGGDRDKVVQITGAAAASSSANSRWLWKDGLGAAWSGRTSGNDVIQLEYSFFTGGVSTSTSLLRGIINAAGTNIGGFSFQNNTKVLKGLAYGDFGGGGVGTYGVSLGASGDIVLPENTWIRVGFAYDINTGVMTWACNDVTPALNGILTSFTGLVPEEFDFMVLGGTANTVASTFKVDDYSINATATESLLSVNQVANVENKFAVYPNPVNNIVNISNSENLQINNVTITDINGRTVKTVKVNGIVETQINVSDLNSGIYFMNIDTNEGLVTKKIIKK